MDNNNMYGGNNSEQDGVFTNAGAAQDGMNNGQQGYQYPPQGYQYQPQGGYEQELEEPVSLGEWLVALLLITFVPCVNVVLMFVWAFSKKEKKSKSNFFKAQLILTGIMLVVWILFMIVFGASLAATFSSFGYY